MTDFRQHLAGLLALPGAPQLSEKQLAQLARHWQLLSAAAQHFNLTAIADDAEAAEKHYFDCLLALPALAGAAAGAQVADIGSGGGFPGLVLAVACPQLQFTLIEATGKKCAFLQDCCNQLGLANVRVLTMRAEEAGRAPDLRAAFAYATARAVAPLAVLAEYALPLLRVGGRLVAFKGANHAAEQAAASHALQLLQAEAEAPLLFTLPQSGEQRALLSIRKCGETPEKYPRRPGMPAKRPL